MPVNRERLLDGARWLTHQERKRRLGLPSEWDQTVWVRTSEEQETTDGDMPNEVPTVEVVDGFVAWSCGTAACFAGHIAIEDGGLPAFWDEGADEYVSISDLGDLEYAADDISDSMMIFGGRVEQIDEHAARSLGIDYYNLNGLFRGHNTWHDMMTIIAEHLDMAVGDLVEQSGGSDLLASA